MATGSDGENGIGGDCFSVKRTKEGAMATTTATKTAAAAGTACMAEEEPNQNDPDYDSRSTMPRWGPQHAGAKVLASQYTLGETLSLPPLNDPSKSETRTKLSLENLIFKRVMVES